MQGWGGYTVFSYIRNSERRAVVMFHLLSVRGFSKKFLLLVFVFFLNLFFQLIGESSVGMIVC